MEDIYKTKEWTYKIEGSPLKISFLAREEKTVLEMVRLTSLLVEHKPTKLIKVKEVPISKPPYEAEQDYLKKLEAECRKRGINPDKK